jgi:hypothetical protein
VVGCEFVPNKVGSVHLYHGSETAAPKKPLNSNQFLSLAAVEASDYFLGLIKKRK